MCLFVGLNSRVVGRRGSCRCVLRMSDNWRRGYGFGRRRRAAAGRYRGCLSGVAIFGRLLESGIASQRGDRLSNV
eukprot:331978-Pleurochrysis_carterae.AAC.1